MNILALLLSSSIKRDNQRFSHTFPHLVARRHRLKHSCYYQDMWKRTPLHYAAREGHVNAITRLVELGADQAANDYLERTPLHMAARKVEGQNNDSYSLCTVSEASYRFMY